MNTRLYKLNRPYLRHGGSRASISRLGLLFFLRFHDFPRISRIRFVACIPFFTSIWETVALVVRLVLAIWASLSSSSDFSRISCLAYLMSTPTWETPTQPILDLPPPKRGIFSRVFFLFLLHLIGPPPLCIDDPQGLATSQDGLAWDKLGPVFDGGPQGSFDEGGVERRRVVEVDGYVPAKECWIMRNSS